MLQLFSYVGSAKERLYFGLAIANEVLRPVAALLLYHVFKERDTENEGIHGIFADVLEGNAPSSSDSRIGQERHGYESLSSQRGGQHPSTSYQVSEENEQKV